MDLASVHNVTSITPATNIDNSRQDILMPNEKQSNQNYKKSENDINSVKPQLLKESRAKDNNKSGIKEINDNPAAPELSEEEKKQVEELKKTDRNVRAHEQAHVAAGGELIKGGVNYSYKTGPDNKKYAVSGKVNIDLSPVKGDAEATIRKMQKVKRAALAPADPSPQDRQIAATASQIESKARIQKSRERSVENDNQYNFISKAGQNKFIEEYKKQQQTSGDLIQAATSLRGELSKLI